MNRMKFVSTSGTLEPIPDFHDKISCFEIWDEIKSTAMLNIILKKKKILIREFNEITKIQFQEMFYRIANDANEDINIVSVSLPKRSTDEVCPRVIQKCRLKIEIYWWNH